MVVFNCNACGESLKKNQVDKHYQTVCRQCEVLSCVDCGKDFWGDDYKQHTQCISEEEKYSGKNYKPKPNANKGAAKQEAWLEKVQGAIDQANPEPRLKTVLETLKNYPNIPRKKGKFEDKSSGAASHNISQGVEREKAGVTENEVQTAINSSQGNNVHTELHNGLKETTKPDTDDGLLTVKSASTEGGAKNKRKRKHEDGKGSTDDALTSGCHIKQSKEKGKKTKYEEHNNIVGEENSACHGASLKNAENTDQINGGKTKVKFNWEQVIIAILQSRRDETISLKKLKKKIIAQYTAQGRKVRSEEKLVAKLDKKVRKSPHLSMINTKVKLVSC